MVRVINELKWLPIKGTHGSSWQSPRVLFPLERTLEARGEKCDSAKEMLFEADKTVIPQEIQASRQPKWTSPMADFRGGAAHRGQHQTSETDYGWLGSRKGSAKPS